MAYEESFPWIVSLFIWGSAALLTQSSEVFELGLSAEFMFLTYQTHKLLTKFNPPAVPQPMLESREWKSLRDLTWSAHETLESKRSYLMGWFYKVPYEQLRREDAIEFLAWNRYGITLDALSDGQERDLTHDLRKLEEEVNESTPLARRAPGDLVLPIMRFNLEPLRFRFKPLPFYGVIHGINAALSVALPKYFGFTYHAPTDSTKDIGYWYRPAITDADAASSDNKHENKNIVFVHGVGGMGFYYEMLKELSQETNGNIVLLDLPFVSLQIADDIPSVKNQIDSVESIMDTCFGNGSHQSTSKATFVGHSFGSVVLSWMVQSKPERVANCVFIDPICFHQHLCKSLFNFHFARADEQLQKNKEWASPVSIEGLMNLAGTEMHTNNAMLRQFSWNANALWPEDLEAQGIPSCILLSEEDAIVPSTEVNELISSFNSKRGNQDKFPSFENFVPGHDDSRDGMFVRSHIVKGVAHGQLLFDGTHRHKVLNVISAMLENQQHTKVEPLDCNHNHVPAANMMSSRLTQTA
jgi:pimeloyl-ACP methyl ester carboxylesterase